MFRYRYTVPSESVNIGGAKTIEGSMTKKYRPEPSKPNPYFEMSITFVKKNLGGGLKTLLKTKQKILFI